MIETMKEKVVTEQTALPLAKLSGHSSGVNCMALSTDESVLVTGADDNTARIWTTDNSHACIGILEGHKAYVTTLALLDRWVFTGAADADVRKWDLLTCQCLFVYTGHVAKIHKLLVTPELLFTTSHDKTAKVWLMEEPESHKKACIRTLKGHALGVYTMTLLNLVSESESESERRSKHNLLTFRHLMHPDDLVATAGADATIKIWKIYTAECIQTLRGHKAPVLSLWPSTSGRLLVSCGADGLINYFNLDTGKKIKRVQAHKSAIVSSSFGPKLMLSGGQDGLAKCFVTHTADEIVVYGKHPLSVTVVCMHNHMVLTGCGDGLIRCFEAKSGVMLAVLGEESNGGAVVALAVANNKVFAANADEMVRVYSLDIHCDDGKSVEGEEELWNPDESL